MKACRLYEYISLRRGRWPVKHLCKVLNVSESGYYRSLHPTSRSAVRQLLLVKIKEIIAEYPDNKNYGARRVHLALLQQKERVSYSAVYRLMKENGLLHKAKRHPHGITKEDSMKQGLKTICPMNYKA